MVSLFIVATLSCLVDSFASPLLTFVASWFFSESSEDRAMRKDLIAIKKEMSSTSMMDEFPKYARLQRKYNKLQDETKEKINARAGARIKLQLLLTYGIRVLNGIFTSIFLFLYRKEPVMLFQSGSLWPLESILSWPTAIESCVSLPIWIMLMRLTVSSCNKIISS